MIQERYDTIYLLEIERTRKRYIWKIAKSKIGCFYTHFGRCKYFCLEQKFWTKRMKIWFQETSIKNESEDSISSIRWNRMRTLLSLFGPLLTYGLYHLDLFSDFMQSINLFSNCHFFYGSMTLLFVLLSYVFTVLLLMYYRKKKLSVASCYTFHLL